MIEDGLYISAQEPVKLRAIGTVSQVSEDYGCDMLVVKNDVKVGIQRKRFPDDLAASLKGSDNRLAKQADLMQDLTMGMFVLEGEPFWNNDGTLYATAKHSWGTHIGGSESHITKSLVASVTLSLGAMGYGVHWVSDLQGTIDFALEVQRWLGKDHQVLELRKKQVEESKGDRLATRKKKRTAAALQQVPGVGVKASKLIADKGRLVLYMDKGTALRDIQGVGKKMADEIETQFGA